VLLGRVAKRLKREYGEGAVRVPSNPAAYANPAELERGRGTLKASRKAHRSISNRSAAPNRRFRATRPGEYVRLDSAPLNVFGIEPLTGRWMRVELTVAMCLHDRSILGLRLAPVSTKTVDVAGVLMEARQPFECPAEWGTDATCPYHGVATEIVCSDAG
jgi:hypothetical protein